MSWLNINDRRESKSGHSSHSKSFQPNSVFLFSIHLDSISKRVSLCSHRPSNTPRSITNNCNNYYNKYHNDYDNDFVKYFSLFLNPDRTYILFQFFENFVRTYATENKRHSCTDFSVTKIHITY